MTLPEELRPYKAQIESSKQEYIRVKCQNSEEGNIFTSKIGGKPYWPAYMPYPSNKAGTALNFLAQINCAELPVNAYYPKQGILQFFIGKDDLFGMDFEYKNEDQNYCVVFHKDIDQTYREDFDFLMEIQSNFNSPLANVKSYNKLQFELKQEYVPIQDYQFEKIMGMPFFELFGKFGDKEYELTDAYNKMNNSAGHKMGGYAFFTQEDPRGYSELMKDHVLLLQLDSEDGLMWGDMGVSGFFISASDLAKGDFSKVIFNWDCH